MSYKDLIIEQMNNDNVKANTHEGRLLDYLEKFGSITSLEAIQDLGNTRLSGTIYTLKRKGYDFNTESVSVPNRFGGKTKVAKYHLLKNKQLY
tara:strand:- start:427 stop:705 length:279 start_codon:yes stop_codon:yes gene_type:complete